MNARNHLEALMGIINPPRPTPPNAEVPIEEKDGHYLCAAAGYRLTDPPSKPSASTSLNQNAHVNINSSINPNPYKNTIPTPEPDDKKVDNDYDKDNETASPDPIIVDWSMTNIMKALRESSVTPDFDNIQASLQNLCPQIPEGGTEPSAVIQHVVEGLSCGLLKGQSGPRYFGFVTGGALPAAQCGDILATIYDQNVQVHLPTDTTSTAIEHRTLEMVLDLLNIPRETFPGMSLTTGATASNILGLACGRDFAVRKVLGNPTYSVGDDGFPPGVQIRILTDRHHASIEKAAAVLGIGRKNIVELPIPIPTIQVSSKGPSITNPNEMEVDLDSDVVEGGRVVEFADILEGELVKYRQAAQSGSGVKYAVIVVVSFAEVNTGDFTVMYRVKELCKAYGAWLHIDAAFGALACLLPEYKHLTKEMALADSLTADGHKWFNVPYASGLFYCKSLDILRSILAGSTQPAYLATTATSAFKDTYFEWVSSVPSPLHTNLENSRRFAALPLYCALVNLGRKGYEDIVTRNVEFAREIADWMTPILSPTLTSTSQSERKGQQGGQGSKWYEVLNLRKLAIIVDGRTTVKVTVPLNIVLFRARDADGVPALYRRSTYSDQGQSEAAASAALVRDINATGMMYVSPGAYEGGAVRMAVSNWMTGLNDLGRDIRLVKRTLKQVMTNAAET